MDTFIDIKQLKGIGEKTAMVFHRMGIYTVDDLIHYYPRGYEDNTSIVPISDVVMDGVNLVKGIITSELKTVRKNRLLMTSTTVEDETGRLHVTWFNQGYLKNSLKVGQEIYLKGKVTNKYSKLSMSSPKILKNEDIEVSDENTRLPVYSLTKGVGNKAVRNTILQALDISNNQIKEFLPMDVKNEYNLCDINFAVNNIHQPKDDEALEAATDRLIFDEFFLFQLGLQMLKSKSHVSTNGYQFKDNDLVLRLLDSLPFSLTNAQQRVYEEIIKDLNKQSVMNRLVQGDVGSGKTIVAALALVYAVNNGYQSAMMAPTEVLAKQHFQSLKELLEPLGIEVEILVGSMTKKQKTMAYERIKSGDVKVLVGTHALIQEGVEFNNLALVITDEQHRFGVNQREQLANKGVSPHVLVMSATPIPRTLALIVYGDMDISIIDELPPGRTPIKTYPVNSSYRDRIYGFIVDEIKKGRQCYIVCPMVEENEELEIESVIEYSAKLTEKMPPNIRVTYLHGKMKGKEKNAIMEEFASGNIDILVSTTVIEVGVNVPNSSIMVIENAERFGLAQLHQLRGRVGRGQYESHCILVTDSKTKITKQRMKVMKESNDGFVISEYDLKLRGPGDLLGLKQHGLPEFRIGNIFDNMDVLKVTNNEVKGLIKRDPLLELEEHRYLKQKMEHYFNSNVNSISL